MDVTVDHFVESDSVEGTLALGESLGKALAGGEVLGLVGPLGAGKTQWVKGLARGIGMMDSDQVTSPTFTLVQEYGGRLTLFHLDVYRLSAAAEFDALGVEEMIRRDSAVVVEWADRVSEALPADTLWIEITPTAETFRRIGFRAGGVNSRALLERWLASRSS